MRSFSGSVRSFRHEVGPWNPEGLRRDLLGRWGWNYDDLDFTALTRIMWSAVGGEPGATYEVVCTSAGGLTLARLARHLK